MKLYSIVFSAVITFSLYGLRVTMPSKDILDRNLILFSVDGLLQGTPITAMLGGKFIEVYDVVTLVSSFQRQLPNYIQRTQIEDNKKWIFSALLRQAGHDAINEALSVWRDEKAYKALRDEL